MAAVASLLESGSGSRPSFEELLRSLAAEHERQLTELRARLRGSGTRSTRPEAQPQAIALSPPPIATAAAAGTSTVTSWALTVSSLSSAGSEPKELVPPEVSSEMSEDSVGPLEKLAILKDAVAPEALPGGVPRGFSEDQADRTDELGSSIKTLDLDVGESSGAAATVTTATAAPEDAGTPEVDAPDVVRRFVFDSEEKQLDEKRASHLSIFSVPEGEAVEGSEVSRGDSEGTLPHSISMGPSQLPLAQSIRVPDVGSGSGNGVRTPRWSENSLASTVPQVKPRLSSCSRTEGRRQSIRQSVRQSVRRTLNGREFGPVFYNIDSTWTDLPEIVDPDEAILDSLTTGRPTYTADFKMQTLRRKKAVSKFSSAAGSFQKFIYMNPTSQRRLLWDVIGIMMITYDLVLLPLHAFPLEAEGGAFTDFMIIMGQVTTSYWTLDIFSNFLCGYQTEKDIEMDPLKIAMHYIKGWFPLDMLLVLSDIIVTTVLDETASFLRFGKSISRGMRVVRMIRLVKLRRIMADIMDRIPSEYARTLLRVLKLLMFIIMLNHYIACGWFWLGTSLQDSQSMTWVLRSMNEDSSIWYFYVTSLHWSLTQFTPASMEVVPTNRVERTYSVCVLMFALVTFSSFVSTITSSVTHLQHINARKLHNQVLLRRYLSERRISAGLVLRVCHYSQVYQRSQGGMERKTGEDKVEALKILPASMRQEIRWEAFSPSILAHPLFFQYNIATPTGMREVCSRCLSEVSLAVVQELFTQPKAVKQMLFVLEGALKYTYPANLYSMAEQEVGKHQWACEVAIWAEKVDLYGPFVATCCCDILLLGVQEFQSIARLYPSSFLGLACYAERFIEHVMEVGKECRWKTIFCNGFDMVHEMAHLSFDSDLRISRRSSRASRTSLASCEDIFQPSRVTESSQEEQRSSVNSRPWGSLRRMSDRAQKEQPLPAEAAAVLSLVVPNSAA
mmetsp:Transcript_48812/g.128722  ORF Transcript_48812/g.128722 Transcript_48812/m.128722 type:complete len:956 (+) Transcript_48812:190-3057(+)